jgi:asparagine synthase (glutamine-hydrolysing)
VDLFANSVKARLVSDVEIGSCLSGGLDSTSIVCKMKKFENNTIKTFSLVFPGLDIDESYYIDEVVKYTNVESNRISIFAEDLRKDITDLIKTQEEPFESISMYGQYKIMELANKTGIKVLLDGQGADELFAGYPIYYLYKILELINTRNFKELINLIAGHMDMNMILLSIIYFFRTIKLSNEIVRYIYLRNKNKFIKGFNRNRYMNLLKNYSLDEVLIEDITNNSIPALLRYEDKNSMRWGVESRVPFLDFRLVEFAASIKSDWKLKDGMTKYIFRKAMASKIPNAILERRDKIGFATPDYILLNSEIMRDFIKKLINSSKFNSRRYWRSIEIRRLIKDDNIIRKEHIPIVWRLICTELWLEAFIDNEADQS